MNIGNSKERVRRLSGVPVLVCPEAGPAIAGDRDAADLVGEALSVGAQVVALPVARLGAGFLDLSTRLAGEALQKFVNYGLRVAIVGDISGAVAQSTALRDFVRESNRGRQVWFVPDLTGLEARLADG
ncbi:DUF4180 domain-containing protein [Phenylobacterium terrae]|uniref:DUF4180 domain-containing protein n=1 Tax=Phenylobacterium terrae TaxID=2665495 RepID=UPI00366C041B